ncbi:MAG TPA: hypothetical protein VHM88_00030, partial [Candidatus Acidoferrales bacterium]|nr:hypothetical protein [Candidatus Acidoferrales bacterium]
SRNIQRCGMKLRVTPLSGLYSKLDRNCVVIDKFIIQNNEKQLKSKQFTGTKIPREQSLSGTRTRDRKTPLGIVGQKEVD